MPRPSGPPASGRTTRPAVPIGLAAGAALLLAVPVATACVTVVVTGCPASVCQAPGTTEGAMSGTPGSGPGVPAPDLRAAVVTALHDARAGQAVDCRPLTRSAGLDKLARERAGTATTRTGRPAGQPLAERAERLNLTGPVVELVARQATDTTELGSALRRSRLAAAVTDCTLSQVGVAVAPGVVVLVLTGPAAAAPD